MKNVFLWVIIGAFLLILFVYLYALLEHRYTSLESQIGANEERLSQLDIKPKTGVDEEKIKLATQLAEANTKLINVDIDKLKLELKDSNQQWLWGLAGYIGMIVTIVVAVSGVALWFFVKSLIADRVEKSLNGFKDAVEKVSILEDQFKILQKELAVSVLDNFTPNFPVEIELHNEAIKALSEEMLLEVFSDETRDLKIRLKAADVLVSRKSPQLVSPMLTTLNSIVDLDIDSNIISWRFSELYIYSDWLSEISTKETYLGLKKFLNRLIKENLKNKDLFLSWTVFLLAYLGIKLDLNDSVGIPISVISDLNEIENIISNTELITLAKYFDKFQEPEGIKEIYNIHAKDRVSDLEETCLNLLEKYDPNFVKKEREEKASTNTESEETNESDPTE